MTASRLLAGLPLAYPLALVVALVAVLPLMILVFLAFDVSAGMHLPRAELLINTLLLVVMTVSGAWLLGVPLALLTACVQLPLGRLWLVLLAAPLAMPSYLGAFTCYAAFGRGGEIENLTGISTPPVSGLAGSVLVMVLYTYPFVMLTTRAALLSLDASQIHAARTLGLPLLSCLARVVLPRAVTGMTAGALLVALYTLSDFGTPAIMGLDTFTRAIYTEYNAFGLGQAAFLSLQLLCIVGLLLYLDSRIRAIPERPGTGVLLWPSAGQIPVLLLLVLPVIGLALLLPLGVFTLWLLREGGGGFDFEYAWNSTSASLLAAVAAVVVALPVAHVASQGRLGRVLARMTYFGFGVPGIVMGTALVYLGLQLPALYQTLALLVLAYVLRFLPLAVGALRVTVEKLDSSLVKAAQVLGAGPGEVLRRITLPLTVRGMVAGTVLVFLEGMRELPATLLLAPTGFETLATYLWRMYEAGYFGRAAVPGLLLVLMSGLGLAAMFCGESRAGLAVAQNVPRKPREGDAGVDREGRYACLP